MNAKTIYPRNHQGLQEIDKKKIKNLRRKTIQETAKIEDQVKVQRQMTSKKSR